MTEGVTPPLSIVEQIVFATEERTPSTVSADSPKMFVDSSPEGSGNKV